MNNKKVCCVILNYNDAAITIALVTKIMDYQSIDYILVVDNCSTDNSYQRLIDCSINHSNIILIRTDENKGYGAGNNYGVKYAIEKLACKYVLISNPDVVFSDKLVANLVKAFDNEKIAVTAPVQMDRNQKIINGFAWAIPKAYQYILSVLYFFVPLFGTDYKKNRLHEASTISVDCVPGSLLMVDSDIFTSVGGYDEKMFLFCEETVLGYKLKSAGYETKLLTKDKYVHMHGISIEKNIKVKRKRNQLLLSNRYYFLKQYLHCKRITLLFAKLVFWISDKEMIFRTIIKGN